MTAATAPRAVARRPHHHTRASGRLVLPALVALFALSAAPPGPLDAQPGTGTPPRRTGGTTTTSATKPDSTKPARKPSGALGPQSGDRHLAYRDMGSELDSLWPPKMPAPLPGSILPARRIIAFYGNPLSQRMGILGEFEPEERLPCLVHNIEKLAHAGYAA